MNEHETGSGGTLVLLSGGIDSFCCAHFLLRAERNTATMYVDYGHAAAATEARTAAALARYLGVPFTTVRIDPPSRTGVGEILGRNLVLISLALFAARPTPAVVAIGCHAGTSYYDCSEVFFQKLSLIVTEYTGGKSEILAPFLTWTKPEIVAYAHKFRLPLEMTYSCEAGVEPGCGRCLSCRDREALYVR